MNDKEMDVLKMLFAEHHRQLAEKRQKIHSVAEKTLAIFLIVAGWLILTKEPLTLGVRWVISIVSIVLAFGACRSIYKNNHSYHVIARVVGRINEALGLYEGGELSIYPYEWKDFGKRGEFEGAFYHT
jgi:hypothetical protein